jgi:hypothetical protein
MHSLMNAMKPLLLLSLTSGLLLAQFSTRGVIRTSGQFEPSGNVVYSVYVAAGPEDLEQMTITASLPPGTRYLEVVQTPLGASYDGVKADTVWWTYPKLEQDTVLGPFVFRVKLDGSGSAVPATIHAALAFERPIPQLVLTPEPSGTLTRLAESGSIVIDQRGTVDADGKNGPAPVGDTGVVLFVPEGAVGERVTITFTRLDVTKNKLPATDPPTWWCSLYKIVSEPQVNFSKSISLALPARRALTPGIQTSLFTTNDLETWNKALGPEPGKSSTERGLGFGGGGFNQFGGGCISQFGFTTCGFGGGFGFGGFGGFGYVEQDNLRGKTQGTTLGSSAISALVSPPSIIAILIGARP